MIQKVFGYNVKQFRLERGLSQDALALACGIDRSQITKIENGKVNVTLDTVQKISDALSIETPSLFLNREELHPFCKWAGGKGQLINTIRELMPNEYNAYFEPFIGGGALFFNIAPFKAVINDLNSELMCVYECFKDDEFFNLLKEELLKHEANHSEEYYYKIRSMDKENDFESLPKYIRAARMIYVNKACFNGLYRVNSKGFFNVPSGKKLKVKTFDEKNFENLHKYFKTNKITILNEDFESACNKAAKGDFVYFDPPYDTLEERDSFTAYSKDSFGKDSQIKLASLYTKLAQKGAYLMLSNHNTSFIRELYKDFNIHVVTAKRVINSNANGRGEIEEVIITNY